MKESLGVWPFRIEDGDGRLNYREFVLDDGILFLVPVSDGWERCVEYKDKRAIGERFFGDSEFFNCCSSDFVDRIIDEISECEGKDEDWIRKILRKYVDRREERRTREFSERKKWEALRDKFDGAVIGLDKTVDVYNTGFSVRVLFSSEMTFAGKSRFLKENRIEFVKWVMSEIEESKTITRRIGSIKFYKPVEIDNLRGLAVDVKFEIKREVA